ncbi:hypothetical protein [Azospirillum sp. sgz301742]
MGGLTPIASAVMPVASTALTGYQQQQYKAQNAAVDQQYQAQRDAADRAYQQQALDRRYAEDRQARLEAQQQSERAQQAEWQRQDQLRQQDLEVQRQKDEAAAAQQAAQRRSDMAWLGQSQSLDAAQLIARQNADAQAAGADAQTRLAAIAQQSATDEQRRRDALRRSVGRTRADLGGQGVSSADGSGEAILLGLVGDSAQESSTAAQVDQLKRQAIQQELDNSRRRNLLEQAQLAQRQRMDFMSKFF